MSSLRPFQPLDLFRFNLANLDSLTETYDNGFYLSYLARWPSLFTAVEGTHGEVVAYKLTKATITPPNKTVMGKLEASPTVYQNSPNYLPWHAHITALTVAPPSRRLGLARLLTESLERAGDEYHTCYSVFRRVVSYYSDDIKGGDESEDAFDMRKPLARDKTKKHIREKGEDFRARKKFMGETEHDDIGNDAMAMGFNTDYS
ncbi:MAG: N(alpha)-acetyltransferase 20, NatB catalytic subunit [Geoglossum simile]|nr:MAG: N(alpha)-acetyltransferase 20, NatB catalytic subunit [Geoglossum simile]